MSEGLAYHLSQGRNHLWFILTLICTIAFLGFLLGLMIFEYRNNHCVFSGPSACYTSLANTSQAEELYQFNLEQVAEQPSGLISGDHELLTFEYIDSSSSEGKSFFVDLIYDDFTAGHGITYPSNLGLNSGFCVTTTGTSGVSIYLKYYFDSTTEWKNSHNVVEYGVSEYINTISDGFVYLSPIETDGFVYITPRIGTHGTPSITSSSGEGKFYFQNFTKNKEKMYGIQPSNSPISYNPMHDFFEAKEKTKQSRGCNNSEKPCVCIDPSSKNLPSCKQNYIAGHGYLIPNSSPLKYTTNCSHSYFPGETVNGGTGTQNPNYVEQIVASGSQLAKSLSKPPEKGGPPGGGSWDPSAGGRLPDSSQVPLKIGHKTFKKEKITSWTSPYVPSNIFCGQGPPNKEPAKMSYNLKNVASPTVFNQMSGSSVPAATFLGGGKVKLGFN